mmetsp:Transcript_8499/g.24607  ORF Transcript_8499/g.24607 Transcript_8499/m.24607 type:complete len:252 (-) Transcript_8499:976-1731(-)
MAPPASASAKAPTKSQAWLYLLFFSSTLEILAISLTIPSYPKLMKDVGMTLQGQTLVTSLISLVTFFMTPILGRLSDRIGRTLVLRLSSLGQLCVNLMLARFTRWEYVAAARLMAGFTRAFTPVSYAYISGEFRHPWSLPTKAQAQRPSPAASPPSPTRKTTRARRTAGKPWECSGAASAWPSSSGRWSAASSRSATTPAGPSSSAPSSASPMPGSWGSCRRPRGRTRGRRRRATPPRRTTRRRRKARWCA